MYAAFLSVIVAAGAPPLLSALILAFFSNLFGCLTHYGSGPAPVFFGSGYVTQQNGGRSAFNFNYSYYHLDWNWRLVVETARSMVKTVAQATVFMLQQTDTEPPFTGKCP